MSMGLFLGFDSCLYIGFNPISAWALCGEAALSKETSGARQGNHCCKTIKERTRGIKLVALLITLLQIVHNHA